MRERNARELTRALSAWIVFGTISLLAAPAWAADGAGADEDSDGPGFGLYADLGLAGMFAMESTHEWGDTCPALNVGGESWEPGCSTRAPLGLLAEARLGLRFGYLGIEGLALGAVDWSNATLDQSIPGLQGADKMQVGRAGGGVGAGVRLMTSPGIVRVGAGVGGGVMFRHVYTTVSSLDGSSKGYQAPFVAADLTLTVLRFINLGLMTVVEFPGSVTVDSNFGEVGGPTGAALDAEFGSVEVFQGPQLFIGPRVGIHLGG